MRRAWTLLAATLLLAACSDGSTSPTDPESSGASASPRPDDRPWTDITDEGGATLPVADADWLQVVGDHAWTTVSGYPKASLQQLDAATGAPEVSFTNPADTCTAMDVGEGSLWAAVCRFPSAELLRVDPDSGSVAARIRLPGQVPSEGSVAAGEGWAWVVVMRDGPTLVRIDPDTDTVVGTSRLPAGVAGVRAGLGGLWATNPESGRLLRLDPMTGRTVATTDVGAGARFFAVGEGAVSRVDPASDEVVATIEVDDGPVDGGDLAVGGGFVWARVTSWLVSQIDPATNEVVARYGPPAGSGSVAADDDSVWISAHDEDVVYRLPLD